MIPSPGVTKTNIAKAEKELVKANAHAKTMHLMSTHADLIPRVRLIHDHFDKDKDGHIMDEEFFRMSYYQAHF